MAARYSGPRTAQFDDAIAAVRRSLQQDPFGLTANILVRREGCTAERCDVIGLFGNPTRLWDNIRQNTFDANVARHAANWRAPWTVIIGSEAHGSSEEAVSLAAQRVYIPLAENAESLNAAIAAGVILFEAYKSRR